MIQQKRSMPLVTDLKIRSMGDGSDSRIIEGYCLKFGVRSRLLCDWYDLYYEELAPGCITREMLDTQDIKLTIYHNREKVLARSKEGVGTLNYEVDSVGVKFWAEMPQTAWGDEALELVRRGDIAGCSFIYSTDEQDSVNAVQYEQIEEDGQLIVLRHVLRIDRVYDFTITTDPAYEQTTVTRREAEDAGVILKPAEEAAPATDGEDSVEGQDTDPEEVEENAREIDLAAKRKLLRETRKIKESFV